MGVFGLPDRSVPLLPGLQLIGGWDNAVGTAHDGLLPMKHRRWAHSLYFRQFFLQFLQRSAGSDLQKGFESSSVRTHPAEELMQ